jgi:hypothetical protein
MPRTTSALFLLPLLLAASCDRGDGLTPEQRQARRDARLAACVTEELQIRARNDLANLESMLGPDDEAPGMGGRAPHTFLRAYAVHADLRTHEAAYMDSAYRAANPADSARLAQTAATFRLNRPMPGTVEGNVVERYRRDFASAWNNPNHPCNIEVAKAFPER